MTARGLLGTLILAAAACAHQPPPPELLQARQELARAEHGPAAQVTPADLQRARDALAEAERAYGQAPSPEVQTRAYVALREAQAAEAMARAILAAESRNRTDVETRAERERQKPAPPPVATDVAPAAPAPVPTPAPVATPPAEPLARAPATVAEAPSADALQRLAGVGVVQRDARGLVLTLPGGRLFTPGAAALAAGADALLNTAADALPRGARPISVEAHTGVEGSREANLLLSQERAETVRSFLISRGLEPDAVVARGFGPDRPATMVATPVGAGVGDDRIEIVLPPSSGGR